MKSRGFAFTQVNALDFIKLTLLATFSNEIVKRVNINSFCNFVNLRKNANSTNSNGVEKAKLFIETELITVRILSDV